MCEEKYKMRFPHLTAHHLWTRHPQFSRDCSGLHISSSPICRKWQFTFPPLLPSHPIIAACTLGCGWAHTPPKALAPFSALQRRCDPGRSTVLAEPTANTAGAAPAQRKHLMPEHTLPSYGRARYSNHAGQHLQRRCDFPMNIYECPVNLYLWNIPHGFLSHLLDTDMSPLQSRLKQRELCSPGCCCWATPTVSSERSVLPAASHCVSDRRPSISPWSWGRFSLLVVHSL